MSAYIEQKVIPQYFCTTREATRRSLLLWFKVNPGKIVERSRFRNEEEAVLEQLIMDELLSSDLKLTPKGFKYPTTI